MDENEDKLRKVAEKRVEARLGLLTHLTLYIGVNTALFAIWSVTGAKYPWFLWPMFGWGIGIVGHLIAYFWGPGSRGNERAVDRELRRLQARPH